MTKFALLFVSVVLLFPAIWAQESVEIPINTVSQRERQFLDGMWNVRYAPFNDKGNAKLSLGPEGEADPNFMDRLLVPKDWNTQAEKLYYFEGAVFYKRHFKVAKEAGKKYFLHFGAANYEAEVYLNGETIGNHIGGFTPFAFEVGDQLKSGNNILVVRVSNVRKKEAIPTLRFDWWNYGGLTRSVSLVAVPEVFIKDYAIGLDPKQPSVIQGWVQLSNSQGQQAVNLNIPGLRIEKTLRTDSKGRAHFSVTSKKVRKWSPEDPFRYEVNLTTDTDSLTEAIGFRTITVNGGDILLNGKKLFLKGINLHEEAPMGGGRIAHASDARTLLSWAKELGCNLVRLAHYPHNELMVREAEKMGLMVWEEIPVYWNIDFENEASFKNADRMLRETIIRDRNRASVVLWSVANETRESEARQNYLKKLLQTVNELDNTRLTTAAIEAYKVVDGVRVINDVIAAELDVIGINCYCGWYFNKPSDCPDMGWQVDFNKPVIFSEFGAGALQGHYGGKDEKWTEDYQEEVFKYNLEMVEKQMPFVDGMTPWLLMDFRSPIRPNRLIQNDYNRKGLISEQGIKKKAFYTLQEYYSKK
ncbi:glycoside hydrolase family 2 protein [Sediminicola luteus]|nr:glycoside hydrolase family 2 TIM barrel-domain containing protein [Sediminicola luteus]